MSRTNTWLARLAVLCLPFFLGGCLEYREVLTLTSAGSGSLEAELSLDLPLLRELSAVLGEDLDPEDLAAPTRAEFEGALRAEGVQIQELDVQTQEGRTWARFRIEFDDLDALHRLDAFGARRQLAIFDHGQGQVLVVSRFDPREVVPLPGFGGPRQAEASRAVAEVVERIREATRLQSELRLPGAVLATNGEAVQGGREVVWRLDALAHPELGEGEARMKVLCQGSDLPWATELEPTPPEAGPVEADALALITSASEAATTAAPLTAAPPEAVAGGRSSGCSLGPAPQLDSSAALLWALLCGSLALARCQLGARPAVAARERS